MRGLTWTGLAVDAIGIMTQVAITYWSASEFIKDGYWWDALACVFTTISAILLLRLLIRDIRRAYSFEMMKLIRRASGRG